MDAQLGPGCQFVVDYRTKALDTRTRCALGEGQHHGVSCSTSRLLGAKDFNFVPNGEQPLRPEIGAEVNPRGLAYCIAIEPCCFTFITGEQLFESSSYSHFHDMSLFASRASPHHSPHWIGRDRLVRSRTNDTSASSCRTARSPNEDLPREAQVEGEHPQPTRIGLGRVDTERLGDPAPAMGCSCLTRASRRAHGDQAIPTDCSR